MRLWRSGRQPASEGPALMGWTLGRYFFFRYATITTWFFLGIFALVFLIDFTELSSRTAGLPGFTVKLAFAVSALRVPMIMQQTVPFVALFSAMATLVSLNRKYELVIARAAGISAWQFLFPFCLGALLFGAADGRRAQPACRPCLLALGTDRNAVPVRQVEHGFSLLRALAAAEDRRRRHDHRRPRRAQPGPGTRRRHFFSLDSDGDIIERRDAARAYLRDGYWELTDVKRLQRRHQLDTRADRPRGDQSEAGIRPGAAGAARNHPVLRPAGKDRGGAVVRPQGQHVSPCSSIR